MAARPSEGSTPSRTSDRGGGAPVPANTGGSPSRSPRFAAFQSRNFRLLWTGLVISNAGTWMAATAAGWLVTDLKPDRAPFWLGVIAAAFALPMVLLPPFGGAIADRLPRFRLMWVLQIAYLVISAVLALLAFTEQITVWVLVAYEFGNGVVLAFDSPVRHALVPDLVERSQLTSAVSINSIAYTGAGLIGPAIAGLLIPVVGPEGVFTVNALSCCAVLVALALMKGVPEFAASCPAPQAVISSIERAAGYTKSSPLLSSIILLSLLIGLLGRSYIPLLPAFARDEFGVGSRAFGLLVSAGGLGTLLGAFWLALRGDVAKKGVAILLITLAQAAFLVAFAGSPWFVTGVILIGAVALCSSVSGALNATLIQLTAPPELRGRIMSFYLLTVVGIPYAGALIVGAIAQAVGVRVTIGAAAVLLAVLTAAIAVRRPSLRMAQ
jgi:MFS family permease